MSAPAGPEPVRATPEQAAEVTALIATAFSELAVSAWLVADQAERVAALHRDFAIMVEYAFEYGHIDLLGDVAAAVWLHHDDGDELPEPPDYDARLAAATGEYLPRFQELDAHFAAHHPVGSPHHHLAFLAVRADAQGGGCGTRLLRRHHAVTDARGLGCYLEASNADSRRLYERHGYTASAPFVLGGDGPPMWPMWRPAGG